MSEKSLLRPDAETPTVAPAHKRRRKQPGGLFARVLSVPKEEAADLLRALYRVRLCEDKLFELAGSTVRSEPGGEAVVVGACAVLRPEDQVACAGRGLAFGLARGTSVKVLFSELAGRAAPPAPDHASNISVAVGVALAGKLSQRHQVTLCLLNAADADRGGFHEAARLAALWHLPIVFLCENPQPLGRSRAKGSHKAGSIRERAESYGMEGVACDGSRVLDIREAVAAACEQARSGKGPALIEIVTCRGPKRGAAPESSSQEELEQWRLKDPLSQFRMVLAEADAVAPKQAKAMEEDVRKEIAAALRPKKQQEKRSAGVPPATQEGRMQKAEGSGRLRGA